MKTTVDCSGRREVVLYVDLLTKAEFYDVGRIRGVHQKR